MPKQEFIDKKLPEEPGTTVTQEHLNPMSHAVPTGEDMQGSTPLLHGTDTGVANAYAIELVFGKKRAERVNDSFQANKLQDSTATFITDDIKIGDTVLNKDDRTSAKVTAVDSETQLTLDADIFTASGDGYAIGPDIFQAPLELVEGMELSFIAANSNTGPSTINVNGTGAKDITKNVNDLLNAGNILAGQVVTLRYDGSVFQLASPHSLSVAIGYFGGGDPANSLFLDVIDGIQFSDESAITTQATLSVARHMLAGVNSALRGYFGGGVDGSYFNEIDGIQFSDESSINPAATLSVSRYGLTGVNSTLKGYFGGGYTSAPTNEIDGIQFSDESAINPSATLSVPRDELAGVNSFSRGYFGAGDTGLISNEIDGIQFSDESAINPAATLSVARNRLAGVQSGGIL